MVDEASSANDTVVNGLYWSEDYFKAVGNGQLCTCETCEVTRGVLLPDITAMLSLTCVPPVFTLDVVSLRWSLGRGVI